MSINKDNIKTEEYYEYIEHVFESRINASISEVDYSAVKSSILERIENSNSNKIESIFYKIYSLFNNMFNNIEFVKIKNGYLQIACFATIICCSVFCYQLYVQDDHHGVVNVKNDIVAPVASFSTDTPNAIITSVKGDVSSLMILESEDKQMTIIWYKEV